LSTTAQHKKKTEVGFIFEDISTDAEDLYAWVRGHIHWTAWQQISRLGIRYIISSYFLFCFKIQNPLRGIHCNKMFVVLKRSYFSSLKIYDQFCSI
jgi:hypothetical protein